MSSSNSDRKMSNCEACDLAGRCSTSQYDERSYLFVNTVDKNQPAAAGVQVGISDKARHIPGGWNVIRGIFTTISCQPTMTERRGIPLISRLLRSGNFFFFKDLENHYIHYYSQRNL